MRNHEYITKMCLGILLKPSACNLIKKILWYRGLQLYYCNRCFPVNFAKYFRIFPRVHFYFLFRTNIRNDTWMRMTSLTVGKFLRVPLCKLLDDSYVESSFSIITRRIVNSILKVTLQLKIWPALISLRGNSFIKV